MEGEGVNAKPMTVHICDQLGTNAMTVHSEYRIQDPISLWVHYMKSRSKSQLVFFL